MKTDNWNNAHNKIYAYFGIIERARRLIKIKVSLIYSIVGIALFHNYDIAQKSAILVVKLIPTQMAHFERRIH